MNKLKLLYRYLVTAACYRPFMQQAGNRIMVIRPILFTPSCCHFGNRVLVRNNARIEGVRTYLGIDFSPAVIIEDNVSIEQNLHLTCAGRIVIGKNTAIAANVTITDIHHPYEDINVAPDKQPLMVTEVTIGEDCKIYNNVVILPGTHLGKHCTVGANSVVRGIRYPDYSVIAGNPAIVLKRYSFEKNAWVKTMPDGSYIN